MEKTAISLAIKEFREFIIDEEYVIKNAKEYHYNDVKQAHLIVSVTKLLMNKLNSKLELEKNQLIEAYIDRIKDTPTNRDEAEQYYTNKFNK